jgi:hypothetical protein
MNINKQIINKPRWLLIDDVRIIPGVEKIARDYEQGKHAIINNGPWECIIFDHDIGPNGTGYDLMCLLEQNPFLIPNNIMIITQNASARPKMEALKEKLLQTKRETSNI